MDDGILTDSFCQVPDRPIHAIGDCARARNGFYDRPLRLESWQNAEHQAEVAASHLADKPRPWESLPWSWSDQYRYNLQIAGLATGAGQVVCRGTPADGELFLAVTAGRLAGAVAIGEGTRMAREFGLARRLIERRREVDPAQLADPDTRLRDLL